MRAESYQSIKQQTVITDGRRLTRMHSERALCCCDATTVHVRRLGRQLEQLMQSRLLLLLQLLGRRYACLMHAREH